MFKRKAELRNLAAFALAMFCFAVTAYYLVFGYGAYLDADMSSELALASHLAKEGKLVSDTWLYSTEVRVLSTQLVFAPLMAMFPHNWRLVRTLGCMILLVMMACSSYYCARKLGADKHHALVFAGLGILPISIIYAQMIVIGAFYVPHAILINVFVAWIVCACREERYAVKGACLLLLGAVMCATSIRYLLCAVLPVAAAGVYIMVFPSNPCSRSYGEKRVFAVSATSAVMSVAGYVLGERFLASCFLWDPAQFGGRRLVALSSENLFDLLDNAFDGLVKLVGFMEHRHLISLQGLFSLGALGLIALAVMLVVRVIRESRNDVSVRFGILVFVMDAVMTLGTFLFIENMYVNRYWIPVMTLGGPMMALCLSKEKNTMLRRISAMVFIGVSLGLSVAQIKNSMSAPQIGAVDQENAAYIAGLDTDFGYATFWNANNLTELTNGQVEAVAIKVVHENRMAYPDMSMWLEVEADTQMNRPDESVFILLTREEEKQLEKFLAACCAELLPLPHENQALYIVENQRILFDTIRMCKENAGV